MSTIDKYFDKFPIIEYSNNKVVDITLRTTLLNKVSNNPYVFYPYEITDNERPDQLSYRYYEDPFKSWIIYLTNNITDPYYEWYLNNNEFNSYIEKKYNSIENAQQKIKYYKNNWETDNITIDSSAYNALPASMKKYWEPNYRANSIISYSRKKVDWISNTNKVIYYYVQNSNGFVLNEICDITFENHGKGKGQIVSINDGILYLHHLSGLYFADFSFDSINCEIKGRESGATTIFYSHDILTNNISDEEEIYWKPVSYYEDEFEKNEFNKTIRVLDKKFSRTIVNDLTELMKK